MFREIILGDNPAGHCFVLRDLFPMSFFKLVMIVLLKIYTTSKIFGKIFLKAIRDTFFPICGLWSGEREGGLGVTLNRKGKFKLLFFQVDPVPQVPPLVWLLNLSIRKILESTWSAYCNDFEMSEWEYFLSKQQIYSI